MSNSNKIAEFNDCINQLMNSTLIVVDKHIVNLLKCISEIPVLMKTLNDTLKITTYAAEFSRAKITLTRPDGKTQSKLKLPLDRNRIFTFVVSLLVEIDSGRRILVDFLREYFFDKDTHKSFAMFVNEVLKPFKAAVESILKSVDPLGFDEESLEKAEKYFSADKIYIEPQTLSELLTIVENVRQFVATENLEASTKVECLEVCEAFSASLHLKNPKMIGLIFIAFKNTLKQFKKLSGQLKLVDRLINQVYC